MRKERFYRGRGGPKRGQRGGGGRRGGGHRRGRGNPRQSAEGGNQRERIAIESGHMVLIDQFMFANPQFVERLLAMIDDDPALKTELVQDFGGSVVQIASGTYRIDRDPFALSIIIHPEQETPSRELAELATSHEGSVFVDTRCVAMVDRELLDDSSLLQRYQQLWFSGQDKACRDLLRDNGGAVRYGFNRQGDELGIYRIPGENVICLWPDVIEPEIDQQPAQAQV